MGLTSHDQETIGWKRLPVVRYAIQGSRKDFSPKMLHQLMQVGILASHPSDGSHCGLNHFGIETIHSIGTRKNIF